ncbi:MAG: cell division protein FtsQ/DivIB [Methylococcales bacterium]|nr:cell division protein FtsQ/DivIB [Methylococcales bacterium]
MMKYINLKWLAISVFIIGGAWAGWNELKAQGADLLPIKYVRIAGIYQHIVKDDIKQALLKQVLTGFLNADMQAIQIELLDLPWIAQVKVRRIWPDTIEVKIYEQYPIARWGDIGLLNEDGDLFIPDNLAKFNKLPLLKGPEGLEKKLMPMMKRLQGLLAQQSLVLQTFNVNDRRAWDLRLSNGLKLRLGQKNPLKKLNRFLITLPILKKNQRRAIEKVDLRYSNGYAVTWK